MQLFSKLFWFTAIAGSLSSILLFLGLLWFLGARSGELDALCKHGKGECSWEALPHLYYAACTAQVAGTLLLFGLAYIIGRGFMKPAATDAAS